MMQKVELPACLKGEVSLQGSVFQNNPEPMLYKILVSLGIQGLVIIQKRKRLGTDRLSGVILLPLE